MKKAALDQIGATVLLILLVLNGWFREMQSVELVPMSCKSKPKKGSTSRRSATTGNNVIGDTNVA